MKWYQNPKVLCFAGGVAAALVGAKVAKSPKTRELCVAGMAKGMKLQQDARVTQHEGGRSGSVCGGQAEGDPGDRRRGVTQP